jgi:adenosine deaminase
MRDLATLPKAHLHLHLDGAMRPSTLRELAGKGGMQVPAIRQYGSFAPFAETMDAAQLVIQRDEDVVRLVREVVEDAGADGAVWIEISVWPGFLRDRLGSHERVVELVLEAAADAATRTGVGVGVMIAANRNRGADAASRTAELAGRFAGRGVVSFGLDGDEAAAPPGGFARAFAIAADAGLRRTPHAGELLGPGSVADALDLLGAERILHGVRAVEDRDLLERLAGSPICLDVCPTSNVMLGVVPSIDRHPLPDLVNAGVRCSLNADDPLLFGTSVLSEYETARAELHQSDDQLAEIARSSLECSSAPADLVARGVAGIDRWSASTPA